MTTAAQWRKAYQVELTLIDSGNVATIRPMDAAFFFKTGRIPDFLAATVSDILDNKSYQMPVPAEKTKDWLTWLDELIVYTFVNPKVVAEPQAEDEIGIDEISYVDKLFVYAFFGRPASLLRRFRDGKIQPVAAVDVAKDNGHQAVQRTESPARVE